MHQEPFYKNKHVVLILTAIVADLLFYFVIMYVNANRLIPYSTVGEYFRENWLIIVQFVGISYFVYYTIAHFTKTHSEKPNGAARFVKEILCIIIGGFILQEIFRTIFIKLIIVPEDPKTLNVKLRMLQMVNVAAILVLYSFMTSMRIYNYLQQKQLELVRWQKEYTQSQFDVLKNQLNPHFLFNSLSVLTSLVYVDADLAEKFIEKLSKTYRYLLEQRDKERTEVTRELDFLRAYIFLLQQRFGKKLSVQIEENSAKGFIIPHSLLIAMEFIVSNNSMSVGKPLQITVTTKPDCLIIRYTANAKSTIEKNSEQQLHHLQKRYAEIKHTASVLPITDHNSTTIKFPFV